MSDANINTMDFKQLRNEVLLLRDELAIMRRKYEDILYNLDDDNFSSKLIKEKKAMKTSITQTESAITLQAEQVEGSLERLATLEITAKAIKSEVYATDENGEQVSRITQTADAIRSEVSSLSNTVNGVSESVTTLTTTATGLTTKVSSLEGSVGSLSGSVTTLTTTASGLTSRVSKVENGEYTYGTLFKQDAKGFTLEGNVSLTGNVMTNGTINGGVFSVDGSTTVKNKQSAYYINNEGTQYGYMGYDGNGAGTVSEAKERVFLGTSNGAALKIESSSDMSFEAGTSLANNAGKIYFKSAVEFTGAVTGLKFTFG